ncbi:MAG: ABC transporter permease [Chloroflexi bacterium]|nr:ABC transporter permease [Chloroflexota bacterium]
MGAYVARGLLRLIPVILLVSAAVFFVFRIVPGDIAVAQLGENADPAAVERLREAWGLNRPLVVQYGEWLVRALRADLGESYLSHQPVTDALLEKLPATVELALLGMALSLVVSIPLGIVAALMRGTWVDQLLRMVALLGFCMPRYWLAILLILLFAVQAKWLPPSGYVGLREGLLENLQYVALPAVSVALTLAAVQMRFLRSSLLDVIDQDFIRTARAKGLAERAVVLWHALKNSLIPFVTVVGLELGSLLGGLVVVEQIFAWPGIGWLTIQSITQRDYAIVQGAVMLVAIGFVTINFVVDLVYAYLDPRIRYR